MNTRKQALLDKTRGGIIVSCQALPDEPLYGSDIMARMALSAYEGGAVGIRCGFREDIRAIKGAVNLPIIGLVKRNYPDSPIYITPTMAEVAEVAEGGADIVALDMTDRLRPGGQTAAAIMAQIRKQYGDTLLVMADISTYEEGLMAEGLGVDFLSTTLSGYTPYSPQQEEPDFALMERLSKRVSIPVFGEGRIWEWEQAVRALGTGVHALIVGTVITRPREITARFIQKTLQGLQEPSGSKGL